MKLGMYITGIMFITIQSCSAQNTNQYAALTEIYTEGIASNISKNIVANYISDTSDNITSDDISNITIEKSVTLTNYGLVDILRVNLNKQKIPEVLKSTFVIVIDNKRRKLYKLNLDDFYPVRTTDTDSSIYISGVNNFRGNLQLLIFSYNQNEFKPFYTNEIRVNDYCSQYQFGTLMFKNEYINGDGKKDIIFEYKDMNLCDEEGNDLPESSATIKFRKKVLFFKLRQGKPFWYE